jgi:hypothetical protein
MKNQRIINQINQSNNKLKNNVTQKGGAKKPEENIQDQASRA